MKTKTTTFQYILEGMSLLTLIITIFISIIGWFSLPAIVPLHYNSMGEINRWGSKNELLILLVATILLYGVLTILSRIPQFWNMAVNPVSQNRELLYSKTKEMILLLKLEIMVIFLYINRMAYWKNPVKNSFMLLLISIVFGTLGYYIWQQFMIEKNTKKTIRIDTEVTRLKNTFPASKYWLIFPAFILFVMNLFVLITPMNRKQVLIYAILISFEVLSFCSMYFIVARGKSSFYSENEKKNLITNRTHTRKWSIFWILCAYNASINGILCLAIFLNNNFAITPLVILLYGIHVCLAFLMMINTKIQIKKIKVFLEKYIQ